MSCREVASGWFCLRDGLQLDFGRLVGPSPADDHAAVSADPRVVDTAAEVEAREAELEAATGAWRDAVAERSRVRAANGDRYMVALYAGDGHTVGVSARDRRRVAELDDRIEALDVVRGEAGERAVRARVAHQRAVAAARARVSAQPSPVE